MKTNQYQVPAPTTAQLQQYEATGCSAETRSVKIAKVSPSGIVRPVKMTKAQIRAEAHRLALKYGTGVEE